MGSKKVQGPRGPLLVLAGGRSQLPLVRRAAELELAPWVFDLDPQAPAAALAPRFDAVSSRDPEAVLVRVRERPDVKPGGIVSGSAAPEALFSAAIVARALGLRGPDPDAVKRVLDKGAQLTAFVAAKIPHPKSVVSFGADEAILAVKRSTRAVLKPATGSDGAWITAPNDPELALRARFAAAAGDGRILVQELVAGDEYSIHALATPRGVHVLAVTRKEIGHNPPLVRGFTLEPFAGLTPEERRRRSIFGELAGLLVKAFDLEHTSFCADVVWTKDGPFVSEVGLALDTKIDRLLDFAGVDVYGALCALALGEELPELAEPERAVASRFLYAQGRQRPADDAMRRAERAATSARARLEWQILPSTAPRTQSSLSDTLGWLLADGGTAVLADERARTAESDVVTAFRVGAKA